MISFSILLAEKNLTLILYDLKHPIIEDSGTHLFPAIGKHMPLPK